MRGHGSLAPGVAEEVVRRRRLESITTNKASGGDGIPVEVFQMGIKDWHVLHECEQMPGDSGGQRGLVCCNSWGHKDKT